MPELPEHQFFHEELRTHSAEEYRTMKQEVERLRHKCEELEAAQNIVHEELENVDEVLKEREMLIEALQSAIRRHPDLTQELLSSVNDDRLRKEITDGLAEPPVADSDEEREV